MAGALLSSMEVYMEDIIAGAGACWPVPLEQENRGMHVITAPLCAAASGEMDLDQAGEQLMSLFSLHHRLSQLAAVQGKKKGPAYQSQTKVEIYKIPVHTCPRTGLDCL